MRIITITNRGYPRPFTIVANERFSPSYHPSPIPITWAPIIFPKQQQVHGGDPGNFALALDMNMFLLLNSQARIGRPTVLLSFEARVIMGTWRDEMEIS